MANTVARYQGQTDSYPTRLSDVVDRLFKESFVMPTLWDRNGAGGVSRPSLPINLFETADSFVFHAAIPGMTVDNLDIQVMGRELTLKGTLEISTPENGRWIWQGIPSGEFFESYSLPVEVDGDNVQASYNHGILSLVLPKAEAHRPKQIKVKSTT